MRPLKHIVWKVLFNAKILKPVIRQRNKSDFKIKGLMVKLISRDQECENALEAAKT